jgi:hypothetical protein
MKRPLLVILLFALSATIYAKKVKFAVDMTDQTISSNGVHVYGNFQLVAGFTDGDWQPNTTVMSNETGTNIYSVVVDIPAFHKYEYKFLNGNQSYNVEWVPTASRVGYDDNDNRWIYVDSTANDTTYMGAILFSGNAPADLYLIRFKVDMQSQSGVDSSAVHIAGNFQGWDISKTTLYSFDSLVYEVIVFDTAGSYKYRYYNSSTAETVPTGCATNSNRILTITGDTVLDAVCFSACTACTTTTGVSKVQTSGTIIIYPNPAKSSTTIEFNDQSNSHNISIVDIYGRVARSISNDKDNSITIERGNLNAGVYFIIVMDANNVRTTRTLVFE